MTLKVVTFKYKPGRGSHVQKAQPQRIRFTADHVNRLRAMVRRNLKLDHEFICITDDPEGLDEFVKVVPMWADHRDRERNYKRLKLLSTEMRDLIGERILHLDLDTVIMGDITDLVDTDAHAKIWSVPSAGRHGYALNPSMMLFDAGALDHIWRAFDADPEAMAAKVRLAGWTGTDQSIISAMGSDLPTWTRDDGLLSYRDHVEPRPDKTPPDGALMVGFYGPYNVEQLARKPNWIWQHWRSLRMDILSELIRKRGWTAGAELGILNGATFFHLLDHHPDLHLTGVDLWQWGDGPQRSPDGYRSYRRYPLDKFRDAVEAKARDYGNRATVIQDDTANAAQYVDDASLDFVFIDADHREEYVRRDIEAWRPKIRKGGMLLGHDIGEPGVKRAVESLCSGYRTWPDVVWSVEV